MKKLLLTIALAACTSLHVMAQSIPLYENFGAVNYRIDKPESAPPIIDALAFANYGSFVITNVFDFNLVGFLDFFGLPYEPNNVLNFTNRGTMRALFGFRFNTATESGRRPAASFVNANGGMIDSGSVGEPEVAGSTGVNIFAQPPLVADTFLLVSATNIVNRGILQADNQSRIRLEGKKVDLSRGGIKIKSISDLYNSLLFDTVCFVGGSTLAGPSAISNTFYPDLGIYDRYWGLNTNDWPADFIYFSFGGGNVALTPPHRVVELVPPYRLLLTQLVLFDPFAFAYVTPVDPTNFLIQAVFVQNADPNISANVIFGPSVIPTNLWSTPVIQFAAESPDPVLGGTNIDFLYFLDYSTSFTNYSLLTNILSSPNTPTAMPSAYAVSRTPPCEYVFGFPPNIDATPSLIYNTDYAGRFITNFPGSAYAWRATNTTIQLPGVPPVPTGGAGGAGGTLFITNAPGRIDIVADELNLSGARFKGEGYVSIKANHLISSSGAIMNVDHVGYTLGSTNGSLLVKDLGTEVVRNMRGEVFAWSGVWTNALIVVLPDPNDPTMMITNTIGLQFHVWIVDNQMQTLYPATVHEFVTHSTNVDFNDAMNITEVLTVDAQRLTVTGTMNILDPLHDWAAVNFPNLLYLTNSGTINITNAGFFGGDRAQPYKNIVNRGSIVGVTHSFKTESFENNGTITAMRQYADINGNVTTISGPVLVDAITAKLDGGRIVTASDIRLQGADFKFRNHTNQATGGVYLSITNTLTDAGAGANNVWVVNDGVNLLVKPPQGDLFGTTIRSTAPRFAAVQHTWAAEDRGPAVAGFSNNVAVGRLVLDGPTSTLFAFSGTGVSNALYVDFLEFRGVVSNDFQNALAIDQNLVIYFADANLPVEQLDGQFADAAQPNGRLRWVRDFAGPNSSVDVLLINGKTIQVNRALRDSLTIDSDGDGVVNGLDFYPFDAAVWTSLSLVNSSSGRAAALSWNAAPQSVYHVEFTTNLSSSSWQPLLNYTNLALTNGSITISDTNLNPGEMQRFYRVRLGP